MVLYLTRLNKLLFFMFDDFLAFVKFITIIIMTFLSLYNILLVLSIEKDLFWLFITCQSAFDSLNKIVIMASILTYYKQDVKTIVEKSLSDNVISRVFALLKDDKLLYLFVFLFKNLYLIECNYKIYNKKLLTIIKYFE